MNKKGSMLAEETLKIVVAVICLGFLVYVLASVYYSNVEAKDRNLAESVLLTSNESIRGAIENVKNEKGSMEEGTAEKMVVNNPEGWHLMSFTGETKPNVCGGKNCLCICDKLWVSVWGRQASECSDDGICLIEENLQKFESIKISEAVEIKVKKENGDIKIIK